MVAKTSNHTPATFQMNTGFTMNGFPVPGGLAVLRPGHGEPGPAGLRGAARPARPAGRRRHQLDQRLPARRHQGVAFRTSGDPIPDLFPPKDVTPAAGARPAWTCSPRWTRSSSTPTPATARLAARVRSYELAARMQVSIPGVVKSRTRKPRRRSSCTAWTTRRRRASAATVCWPGGCWSAASASCSCSTAAPSARRASTGTPTRTSWTTTRSRPPILDKPVAGLLKDLKRRGLLDDTLVLWTTEFGRTPFTQGIGGKGRDHHQLVFTCWMAGAGLKQGFRYGTSDEVGYQPAEKARRASTISTPPSCTCSASITSG